MGLKRPRVLAMYRAGVQVLPAPHTDARILAAARAAQVPTRRRRDGFIALTAAAVISAVFLIRLTNTPPPGSSGADHNDFGIAEGRDGAYLMTFDLHTRNEPGSREGLP